VFDAICIALMKLTGYTRSQFAVIHPGGAVGERLLADRKLIKPKKSAPRT
jgi:D-arabinose 5-phosphate isomerase GutQ